MLNREGSDEKDENGPSYPFGLTTRKLMNNSVKIILFHWWYIYNYDIVIYSKKYILSLHPYPDTDLLKHLGSPLMRAIKVPFVVLIRCLWKVTKDGGQLQWSQPCDQRFGISSPRPPAPLPEREVVRGVEFNHQRPMILSIMPLY